MNNAIGVIAAKTIPKAYREYYYCPWCQLWIPKQEAIIRGRKLKLPHCPICGHRLRTKPRFYKRKKKDGNRSNILYYNDSRLPLYITPITPVTYRGIFKKEAKEE